MPASQQAIGTAKQYQLQHRCSVERSMVHKSVVRQHTPGRALQAERKPCQLSVGRFNAVKLIPKDRLA